MSKFLKKIRLSKIASSSAALILAFSVLLSSFGGLNIFANVGNGQNGGMAVDVWDGQTKTMPAGDGTEESPYLISNGAELAYVLENGSKSTQYYKFTKDIYLNDITKVDWATGAAETDYTPNQWYVEKSGIKLVSGNFDGNGKVIHGLYIKDTTDNKSSQVGAALFPYVGAINITGLGIDDSYLEQYSSYGLGAFIGEAYWNSAKGTIDQCYVGANVTMKGYDVGAIAAGGQPKSTITISNCYSLAKLSGTHNVGMVGDIWSLKTWKIIDSFIVGGKMFGNGTPAEGSEGVYATVATTGVTSITANGIKGDAAITAMAALDWEKVYVTTTTYPVLRAFTQEPADEPVDVWDGQTKTMPAGDGTEASPYLISNGAELAYVLENGSKSTQYYKFTKDIYLNDITKVDWATGNATDYTPNQWYVEKSGIKLVSGNFDGNGKVIHGLYIKDTTDNKSSQVGAALFPYVGAINITGLGIDDSYLEQYSSYGLGAFIGEAYWNSAKGTIDQCYVGANVTMKGYDVGAIAAGGQPKSTITISNCYSLAKLSGTHNVGMVGDIWSLKTWKIIDSFIVGGKMFGNGTPAEGSEGVYATVGSTGVTTITTEAIKGEAAKAAMSDLAWDTIFATVEGKYPYLVLFGNADTGNTPVPPVVSGDVWDGSTKTKPSGDGTEASPYLISNGAELAYVVENGSKATEYYKFTKDIYLNDITKVDWATGAAETDYTPNQWYVEKSGIKLVSGNFDGNGKVIHGLYIKDTTDNKSSQVGAALFPYVGAINITGLGIDDSYLEQYSSYGLGAFIGEAYWNSAKGTIDQCYVGANVTMKGYDVGAIAAGGQPKSTITISNCYSLANLQGTHNVGMVGDIWSLKTWKIIDSFIVGGKIIGNGTPAEGSEGFYATEAGGGAGIITSTGITGAAAKTAMSDLAWNTIFVAVDGKCPDLLVFGRYTAEEGGGTTPPVPSVPAEPTDPVIWDGSTLTKPLGTGTKTDPYRIASAANLAYIIVNGSGANNYYIFINDIYINDVSKIDWTTGTPVSGYTPNEWYTQVDGRKLAAGHFDGNGKVVHGLYIKDTTNHGSQIGAGLFPYVGAINITGLGIDDSYLEQYSTYGLGGFIGHAYWNAAAGTIDQCYVGANVTMKGYDVGAIAAGGQPKKAITIKNCYSLAKLQGTHFAGLIGDIWTLKTWKVIDSFIVGGKLVGNGTPTDGSEDVYATVAGDAVTLITANGIKGAAAKTAMEGLDWDNIFTTVGDDYPILKIFAKANVNDYWSGGFVAPSKGTGTATDPYIISTPEEFAYVVKNGADAGEYYELAKDIYLNDINAVTWYSGDHSSEYTPKEWFTSDEVAAFSGNFNGKGHKVYGLYYKGEKTTSPANTGLGLFPLASNGIAITGVAVENAYLEHYTNYALGGIIGKMSADAAGTITNSYVGATVTIKGYDAGALVGGGNRIANFTIENAYSLATLKFNHNGGLVGDSWEDGAGKWIFKNVYAAGYSVKDGVETAGAALIGQQNSVTVSNSYATTGSMNGLTIIEFEKMQGTKALDNMPNLSDAFCITYDFPTLVIFANASNTPDIGIDLNGVWTGTIIENFSDDSAGTAEDPILISNPGELAYAIATNGGGKYYKLTADIYLNAVAEGEKYWYKKDGLNSWVKANYFTGHIDGDGHCVYGVWYPEGTTGDVGFIGKMAKGSIKNLGLRYSYVRSKTVAGGIIGYVDKGGITTIDQCFVDESVIVEAPTAGGIVAFIQNLNHTVEKQLVITNCYSKVTISGTRTANKNGLIGNAWIAAYEIYNSYSTGTNPYKVSDNPNKSSAYWSTVVEKNKIVESYQKDGKKAVDYFKNIYTDSANSDGLANIWTKISVEGMRGTNAKNKMSGLDFENIWATVENGTPILKIFKGKISGADIDMSADSETFTSGSGTKADPYIITTADQLRYLVKSDSTKGKYYALGNDIYVNDTTNKNWTKNNPAKWYSNLKSSAFAGTIDGMGYSIHGLYLNETPDTRGLDYISSMGAGLFPFLDSAAVVRNIHIRDSFISGQANVGAIGGHMTGDQSVSAEIIGCSVDETVTLRGHIVGGLIGAGDRGVNIYYSYCSADLKNSGTADRVNGLVGDQWSIPMNIIDCYVVGYKVLRGNYGICEGVYSTVASPQAKTVKLEDMIGDNAKINMPAFDFDKVWKIVKGKTPQLRYISYEMSPFTNDEGVKGRVWSGNVATQFAGGTGTKEDPYLIETPEQMAMLVMKGTSKKDTHYKLMADLKLNDTSKANWKDTAKQWFTGVYFRGQFDGNGHIVSGLYYDKEDAGYTGLFPAIGHSSSIKRLGIVNSSITNMDVNTDHTYVGALIGYLENWDGIRGVGNIGKKTAPVVSECFVGQDVEIIGDSVGGIVGGGGAGMEIYNSYVLASLSGSYVSGGIFGDLWEETDGSALTIENCYIATKDRDAIGGGPKATTAQTIYRNVYIDGKPTSAGGGSVKQISLYFMRGNYAKEYLIGFDFNNIWSMVDNGTPVLRCFKNAAKYTCTRDPAKVKISFVTGSGGSQHEPIYGYPMVTEVNVADFPTPTRKGYTFVGWSFFEEGDLDFNLTKFPNFDTYAYAKWEQTGFTQNFEGAFDVKYDVNAGAEMFRPGVAGYSPKFIHGGLRSMHMLPNSEVAPMFVLYYRFKLEVGQKYNISFFMNTAQEGASGDVQLIHSNYADVNDTIIGYETALEFENLKAGQWKEYSYTFTANGPYLIFRTTPGVELFFDDIMVYAIGETGELGQLEGFNPDELNAEPGSGLPVVWVIVIIAGGVVLLAGIVVLTLLLMKKSRAKKAATLAETAEAAEEASEETSEE